MIRTHDAGALRAEHGGETVRLTGWVARRRDHGGVAFVDLRDASGVVQVVIRDEAVAAGLRNEFCLLIEGEVGVRPAGQRQPEPADRRGRGGRVRRVEVLSEAAPLPFQIDDHVDVGEEVRLKYRYLDLRRTGPAHALRTAVAGHPGDPRRDGRARLPRHRDADDDAVDARGRARLPRAGAAAARALVRPAAVAAAVQAAADGRRHGALLPDRPLLPGRGLPRRPAAGVHPARHRDVASSTRRTSTSCPRP